MDNLRIFLTWSICTEDSSLDLFFLSFEEEYNFIFPVFF